MQRELNFTSTYFRRLDRQWGGRYDNGTFYGMVDDIYKSNADMIGSSLTLKPGRAAAVAYLHPMGTETYALFVRSTGT